MTQETQPVPRKGKDRVIHVASVDDESEWRKLVTEALNGAGSCFEVDEWASPEEFERQTSRAYDILVLDEYYEERYARRAGELIEYGKKHHPAAQPIILSHNSPPIDPYDPRFAGIPVLGKNEFQVSRGSKFRTIVREVLPECRNIDAETLTIAYQVLRRKDKEAGESDSEWLEQIAFGEVLYPFSGSLQTRSDWADGDTCCEFEFNEHRGFMTGTGPDTNLARQAFYAHFHLNFQRLLSTREVNRTDEDKKLWAIFAGIVNMDEYRRNRTVIVPHLLGQIVSIDDQGTSTVQWQNCPFSTHLLEDAPSFANLRKGDWVQAIVEQRLLAQTIVRVIAATRIDPPLYSDEQRGQFWNQTTTETEV